MLRCGKLFDGGHGDIGGFYPTRWDVPVSVKASEAGVFIVPTMQMPQEGLQHLKDGTLPDQAVWKFSRGSEQILAPQRLIAVPGDPLTDISATGGVDFAMSRGRIVRGHARS